jgi:hypothetical protein
MKENLKKFGPLIVFVLVLGLAAYAKFGPGLPWTTSTATASVSDSRGGGLVGLLNGAQSGGKVDIPEPPAPVGGTVKGIVEVGASGFNAFAINSDRQGRYKVVFREFGASLVAEGMTGTADVKQQLKAYISKLANRVVPASNIHFVVSSGAQQQPKTAGIIAGLKEIGYVVNVVTADQEGQYAYKSAMHPDFTDKAFVVDIGSGNTKITWLEGGRLKTLEGPGAKYFQKGISDQQVYAGIEAQAAQVPPMLRGTCFVVGGGPNDLAVATGKAGRYTAFNRLETYDAKGDAKIASTLNILKAIQAATGTSFVFNDDAFFPVGLLLGMK